MQQPTPIGIDRVDYVCLKGHGAATCAFLVMGRGGWHCAKGSSFEPLLRQRIAEQSIRARGDNCSGPPTFEVAEKLSTDAADLKYTAGDGCVGRTAE